MREVTFQVAPEFTGWHAIVLRQLAARYERLVGSPADSDAALKDIPVRAALSTVPTRILFVFHSSSMGTAT